jgi:hypothetical protein
MVTTHGRGQSQHGGGPTVDSMPVNVSNKPRGNGHRTSTYLLLQENLGGDAGKGVLTGAELSSAAALDVKPDKHLKEEEVP